MLRELTINSNKYGVKFVLIDDEDYEIVKKYSWHIEKGKTTFYAAAKYHGKTIKMHRLILNLSSSINVVDHIDHDGLNNQKSNLRICSQSDNKRNRAINNSQTVNSSSVYKGVSWRKDRSRWKARINYNKKEIFIGLFVNEIDAAKAYDKAAKKYFGEFACLNFPNN